MLSPVGAEKKQTKMEAVAAMYSDVATDGGKIDISYSGVLDLSLCDC